MGEVESRNQDVRSEYDEKTKQFQLLLYAVNILSSSADDKDKEKEKETKGEESRGTKRKLEEQEQEPQGVPKKAKME